MGRAVLPKAERAVIAQHEAGQHDSPTGRFPGRGFQANCRLCHVEREAKVEHGFEPVPAPAPRSTKPAVRPVVEQAPKVERPKAAKPVHKVKNPVVPRLAIPAALELVPPRETVVPVDAGDTREAWMLRAVQAMRPWFPEETPVGPVRISVGWPGGRGSKKGVRGQCWIGAVVEDGQPAIFVSPDQQDPVTIAGIILHEMVHASGQHSHRGDFVRVAKPLGFLAPFTDSSFKTPELKARLEELLTVLGPFPHSPIKSRLGGLLGILRPPVQSTRMLKVQCHECGCTLRMTRKWLDEAGAPTCGCGGEMQEAS